VGATQIGLHEPTELARRAAAQGVAEGLDEHGRNTLRERRHTGDAGKGRAHRERRLAREERVRRERREPVEAGEEVRQRAVELAVDVLGAHLQADVTLLVELEGERVEELVDLAVPELRQEAVGSERRDTGQRHGDAAALVELVDVGLGVGVEAAELVVRGSRGST
jgi:hypothetical protein